MPRMAGLQRVGAYRTAMREAARARRPSPARAAHFASSLICSPYLRGYRLRRSGCNGSQPCVPSAHPATCCPCGVRHHQNTIFADLVVFLHDSIHQPARLIAQHRPPNRRLATSGALIESEIPE